MGDWQCYRRPGQWVVATRPERAKLFEGFSRYPHRPRREWCRKSRFHARRFIVLYMVSGTLIGVPLPRSKSHQGV